MRKPGLFCCMGSLINIFARPNKRVSAFQVTGHAVGHMVLAKDESRNVKSNSEIQKSAQQ